MRSAFFYTLVISVLSVFSQQPFVRYSENLRKAVPPHYNHDQKNADRGVDKIARRHKVEPRQPPLRPQPEVPWLRWVHEGRWAAQADKNTELHKVRARLLEEKLKPNKFNFKPRINPQLKPKLDEKGKGRIKREVGKTKDETIHEKTALKENARHKREVIMPEMEAKIPQPGEQIGERTEELGKREKRQIILFINKPSLLLARSPKTTPNPFIRDTHIEDYDIIRPEVGEREGMIPSIDSGSSGPGSYPLVSETSDLEYESGYTISMSDSEDWHNYPLTTPSGPNPGWQLSTLADIYQKQKRSQTQAFLREETGHDIKTNIQAWLGDPALTRFKRSPKERKPKIGAYKEKLKLRRKIKDIKRKRRIIRNSKEDKAVKEDLKDENLLKRLLERPRVFPRQTAYKEEISREVLWSNGTHKIIEDVDATVKWINETHYEIYKDKDNSTEEWYHKHHILCYNEEWENKTSEEKRNATIGVLEEEEVEDVKVKETKKTKPAGKAAVKKKSEKRKKGKKGKKGDKKDKKGPKIKDKTKKFRKIMTVKNVDQEPKDPRKDPRERKEVKKSSVSSEETIKKKKKDKKLKTSDEKDTSKSKERKKKKEKKMKRDSEKDEEDTSKKNKRRKSKTSDLAEKDSSIERKEKTRKVKKVKDSQDSEKEKKKDKAKKKKKVKSDTSSEADKKKKKKVRKTKDKDVSTKKDKEKTRKKRSIYRSDESKTAEVKWEKVQKSEYDEDGWTVFGGHDEKSHVYDASYELVETRNITKKPH